MSSCGKHEGNCDVILTFGEESPLMQLPVGHEINIQTTHLGGVTVAYRITGWEILPGGFRELHCEQVK